VNRILPLDPTQATGKTKQLFDAVQAMLGIVPNLFRVLGAAPAALDGYLAFNGALASGTLNVRVREQIALTVAESNMCGYCLSIHTYIGDKVGLTAGDIADARRAYDKADKINAILKLARNIVVERSEVSDAALEVARAAGLTDADIIETVANVAINVFTNYVNHVARTAVDLPDVKPGDLAASS
jgi:uncharacterized peroxidase-related enzyme